MKKAVNPQGGSSSYSYESLPFGYRLFKRIKLTEDRSPLIAINIWSLAAALALVLPMLFVHPVKYAFDMEIGKIIFCISAVIVGMVVYLFLHEGVHGIFIRIFTDSSAVFGFDLKHGIAYASSSWYFKKLPYIIIALAPLAVWGIVFAVMLSDVDENYFWYLYILQIFNVTGSAGDIYISYIVAKMPNNVLAHDMGADMEFYRKTE